MISQTIFQAASNVAAFMAKVGIVQPNPPAHIPMWKWPCFMVFCFLGIDPDGTIVRSDDRLLNIKTDDTYDRATRKAAEIRARKAAGKEEAGDRALLNVALEAIALGKPEERGTDGCTKMAKALAIQWASNMGLKDGRAVYLRMEHIPTPKQLKNNEEFEAWVADRTDTEKGKDAGPLVSRSA